MSTATRPPDMPEECWACGGNRLPLKKYEMETYGTGPRSEQDRWLCPICEVSHAVMAYSVTGVPPTRAEMDTITIGHLLLAEIRGAAS